MPEELFFETLIERDGSRLVGPWRKPVQMLAAQHYDERGSIHDDATARALGFAGGTIEGPTHFSQFEPLCARLWGRDWFESGCLSVHFRSPCFAGDEVRATVHLLERDRAEITLAKRDGVEVLRGTATLGPATPTALDSRLGALEPAAEPRLLKAVRLGARSEPITVELPTEGAVGALYPFSVAQKLAAITEPSPIYMGASPWGPSVLPLELVSVLFAYKDLVPFPVEPSAVGLFADQEIRLHKGPLHAGRAYTLIREVVAVSSSRRSEGLWVRTTAYEGEKVVATMLLNSAYLSSGSA